MRREAIEEIPTLRRSQLHPRKTYLLDLCRWIGFGFIEGQVVECGLPRFDPMPRIVREVKLVAGGDQPRPPSGVDFELKDEMLMLLNQLEYIGTGVVQRIEVKHGVPFRLIVEENTSGQGSWGESGS